MKDFSVPIFSVLSGLLTISCSTIEFSSLNYRVDTNYKLPYNEGVKKEENGMKNFLQFDNLLK